PSFNRLFQAYRPVRMPYLVGVHTAELECASVKYIPSFTILSIFGVLIPECGLRADRYPYPMSSAKIYTILGREESLSVSPSFFDFFEIQETIKTEMPSTYNQLLGPIR